MSSAIQDLIDGYFDDVLTADQLQQLSQWIQSDPKHAEQFAADLLLHDRLRNEFNAPSDLLGQQVQHSETDERQDRVLQQGRLNNRRVRSVVAMATTACLLMVLASFLWNGVGTSSASAAVVELNRIIAVNREALDRTFVISVEETVVQQDSRQRNWAEKRRPPKPSLDNAILDVRGANQFVLRRKVQQGDWFITGSNGVTSWAVRPDGPVRFSKDLTRFNRDLPGHEWSLPINNLDDGLDALLTAYHLDVLPADEDQAADAANSEEYRRIVGVKKRGFSGANQVEITYSVLSGQIRQMRFVKMPYGRNVVTINMTLVDQQPHATDYFDHQAHHDSNRIVEFE